MWRFFWFPLQFRFFQSIADLLIVVSDRIAGAFNRSGATWAVALDISKILDRVWHAGLLQKLESYGILGQIFDIISSFLINKQFWVVLDGKSLQGYAVNARVPQGSILGPTFFLLYINDLPDDVICDTALYAHDTTVLQIRAGQRSITANLWPLTAHIFHVMIIVTGGFFKKSFFIIFRSRHTQMFFKTGVSRNVATFTEKHLCWSLFLIKLQVLWPATSFQPRPKSDFSTIVSLRILWNFYETAFFVEHLPWLLLSVW